jgi:diguanylate cyclase (GGDEF)-like protein
MLAYEWETVKWRADLRRMDERLRDPDRTDALTGLLNRAAFVEALEQEWVAAARGTNESYLVICRFPNLAELGARLGAPMCELLLKDAAEVMQEVIRRSDHAARLAEDAFAALLVGCKGSEGAAAFFERFADALARATRERPAALELASAVQPLAASASSTEALAAGEAALGDEVAMQGETA